MVRRGRTPLAEKAASGTKGTSPGRNQPPRRRGGQETMADAEPSSSTDGRARKRGEQHPQPASPSRAAGVVGVACGSRETGRTAAGHGGSLSKFSFPSFSSAPDLGGADELPPIPAVRNVRGLQPLFPSALQLRRSSSPSDYEDDLQADASGEHWEGVASAERAERTRQRRRGRDDSPRERGSRRRKLREVESRDEESHSKRKSHVPRDRDDRGKKRKRRNRSYSRSRSPPHSKRHTGSGTLPAADFIGADFVLDGKGDKTTFLSENTSVYEAPKFFRTESFVIGLPGARIDHRSTHVNGIVLFEGGKGRREKRYMDVNWDLENRRIKMWIAPDDNASKDADTVGKAGTEDFIPIPFSGDGDEEEQPAEEAASDGLVPQYRALVMPKRRKDDDGSAAKGVKEVDANEVEQDRVARHLARRNTEFAKRLSVEPQNVELWRSFVDFQDEAMSLTRSKAKAGVVGEVKLDILEKALAVEGNQNNEELLMAYICVCEKFWDSARLLTKWDQILRENPTNIRLWKQYLDYRQSNFATFTVGDTFRVYESCISVLRDLLLANEAHDPVSVERVLLHVFQRACFCWRQAGYTERAVACYQALMELNFFCPEELLDESLEQQFVDFELFWESDAPRIGEKGAKGWSYYAGRDIAVENVAEVGLGQVPSKSIRDRLAAEGVTIDDWLGEECFREHISWAPLRPSQLETKAYETEAGDPYRVVLFEDIRGMLFRLRSQAALQLLPHLFLQFLNLPFPVPGLPTSADLARDCFLHDEVAAKLSNMRRFWPHYEDEGPEKGWESTAASRSEWAVRNERRIANAVFGFPIRSYPWSEDCLFAVNDTAAKQGGYRMRPEERWFAICTEEDLQDVGEMCQFARFTISQLKGVFPNDDFALLGSLVLEANANQNKALRTARAKLDADSANLRLWNGYAQLQKLAGNVDEARRTYALALKNCKTFPEDRRAAQPLLYRMYAEMELEQDQPAAALHVLLTQAEDVWHDVPASAAMVVASPIRMLRAKRMYSQAAGTALFTGALDRAVHLIVCHALLAYITAGVDAARKVVTDAAAAPQLLGPGDGAVHRELLYVALAKILFRRSLARGAFRPRTLQDVLDTGLRSFPQNSLLWSLYLGNEGRASIHGRLSRALEMALKSQASSTLWLFAIYAELHQGVKYNAHAVRSLFERALECPSSRSSISIWVLYVHLECREENYPKGKELFYRAVKACPWAKDIYKLAFGVLRPAFTVQELQDVMNLMMEKDLRIRTALDEPGGESDAEEAAAGPSGEEVLDT